MVKVLVCMVYLSMAAVFTAAVITMFLTDVVAGCFVAGFFIFYFGFASEVLEEMLES